MGDYSRAGQVALALVPKFTAALSILGSGWIIVEVLTQPTKRQNTYNRLLCGMSIFDFIVAAFGVVWTTWPIPRGTGHVAFAVGTQRTCSAQGFVMQLGLIPPIYNCCLAIYYLLIVKYGMTEAALQSYVEPIMHGFALTCGLFTAVTGLALGLYNNANLWCWIAPLPLDCYDTYTFGESNCLRGDNAWIYRWVFYFAPLWFIIVFVTVIMVVVYRTVRNREENEDDDNDAADDSSIIKKTGNPSGNNRNKRRRVKYDEIPWSKWLFTSRREERRKRQEDLKKHLRGEQQNSYAKKDQVPNVPSEIEHPSSPPVSSISVEQRSLVMPKSVANVYQRMNNKLRYRRRRRRGQGGNDVRRGGNVAEEHSNSRNDDYSGDNEDGQRNNTNDDDAAAAAAAAATEAGDAKHVLDTIETFTSTKRQIIDVNSFGSRAVFQQCLYYTIAFYITYTWATLTRLLQVSRDDNDTGYGFLLLHAFFQPIQGFFNVLIYRYLHYFRLKHRNPHWTKWELFQHTWRWSFLGPPPERKPTTTNPDDNNDNNVNADGTNENNNNENSSRYNVSYDRNATQHSVQSISFPDQLNQSDVISSLSTPPRLVTRGGSSTVMRGGTVNNSTKSLGSALGDDNYFAAANRLPDPLAENDFNYNDDFFDDEDIYNNMVSDVLVSYAEYPNMLSENDNVLVATNFPTMIDHSDNIDDDGDDDDENDEDDENDDDYDGDYSDNRNVNGKKKKRRKRRNNDSNLVNRSSRWHENPSFFSASSVPSFQSPMTQTHADNGEPVPVMTPTHHHFADQP